MRKAAVKNLCPHFFFLVFLKYGEKIKGKAHPCTGTEALYRPYGP
jgi:hypothetical protein